MITVEIEPKELIKKFDKLTPKIKVKLKTLVGVSGREWQSYVRKKYFTGWSWGKKSNKIQNRTTNMMKNVRPAKVKVTSQGIEGGLTFGPMYAKIHVGPKGQTTKIVPKAKKWLTIPLQAAMTGAGVVRGNAPDSSVWGNTFFQRSKKGNLILFGQRVMQKGKKAGQTTGQIVPLFLLKKSVTVKTRIHPEEIMAEGKKNIIKNLQEMSFK